jgi:hypothetical protein
MADNSWESKEVSSHPSHLTL